MKRTTIYLEPELEILLKMEVQRQKRPMAELVREAVFAYVTREPRRPPPGAGAFASGRADTAERADSILEETGFGQSGGRAPVPAIPTAVPSGRPHGTSRATVSKRRKRAPR